MTFLDFQKALGFVKDNKSTRQMYMNMKAQEAIPRVDCHWCGKATLKGERIVPLLIEVCKKCALNFKAVAGDAFRLVERKPFPTTRQSCSMCSDETCRVLYVINAYMCATCLRRFDPKKRREHVG